FKPQGAELWTRDAPDFPGFYDTIRAQRDVVFDVSVRNVKLPSGQSKDFSYRVITFDADLVAATLPTYHVGDLWWNEAEPGWGISISQGASGQLFGTWYTYRADGSAQWAVMSGGTWETPTRFTGTLYTTTGTPYDRLPFVSGQTAVTAAGSLTLEFSDASHGTMRYTLNGQSNTKAITRQPFSRGAETITDGRNFTGLWNDPAESGHGISLNMQYRTLFGVAYVYDQAGKSAWFTLPGCTWANETDCSGPIYTVTGPGGAVGGTFDPAQVRVTAAGSASVHFVDDYNATLTYTLNGFTATKTIKRYEF
ncbi:MAG: hypothetical protein JNM52_00625, partial [Betaproteobacteria bacterium]|nr:hypothetical protein [Betaproteobacteria bacterium]